MARERPDELVVAGEGDGALRQAGPDGLEPGDERLFIGERIGADASDCVARAQADGAGIGVEGKEGDAVAAEVAEDVEAAGVADLEDGGRRTDCGRRQEPLHPHGDSPSAGLPPRVTMVFA